MLQLAIGRCDGAKATRFFGDTKFVVATKANASIGMTT